MPVKNIELVPGEDIDQPLDIRDRIKLPADIEMTAAPCVAGLIGDSAEDRELEGFRIMARSMQQLRKTDQPVKQPGRIIGTKNDLLCRETQLIGRLHDRGFPFEADLSAPESAAA